MISQLPFFQFDKMTWEDLPVETLNLIIKFLPVGSVKTIHQCALVCRNWKTIASHQLYAAVSILSIVDMSKFNRTIVENGNAGKLVKTIKILADIDLGNSEHITHIYTLLSNLPNLQHFDSSTPCFQLIADALIESKLNNLTTLGDPLRIPFTNEYVTCALLMKDRLQNAVLEGNELPYYRLHSKLDQFKKLEEIIVDKAFTKFVEEFDPILEKCANLRKIVVRYDLYLDEHMEIAQWEEEIDAPFVYKPNPEIYSLQIKNSFQAQSGLLTYIMHKYPNLKTLRLTKGDIEVTNMSIFRRCCTYLSKIENLYMERINTDVERISEVGGSCWEAMRSKQPNKLIDFRIEPNVNSDDVLYTFENTPGRISTTLEFPVCEYNFQLMDLFIKYGDYVGDLHVSELTEELMIGTDDPAEDINSIENLIASIRLCGKLNTLVFTFCFLKQPYRKIVFKKDYLQKLSFEQCTINIALFNKFFTGIGRIDVLHMEECKYLKYSKKPISCVKLDMPNTTIGTVLFGNHSDPCYSSKYIFFFISENYKAVDAYYKYDPKAKKNGYFKVSSVSEFEDRKYAQCIHLYIHCRSITSVRVKHVNGFLCLPKV